MLVAAHALLILLLLVAPVLVGRRLAVRLDRPRNQLGVGLLAFIAAEIFRLMLMKLSVFAFENGLLPLPSQEAAPVWDALIAGLVTATATLIALRLLFRTQLPERHELRDGLVVGAGYGIGALGLTGLLEGAVALAALLWKDSNFEEVQEAGFSPRTAIKVGMRVYEWWERSVGGVFLHALEWVLHFAFALTLGALVAHSIGRRRWLLPAWLLWGAAAFAASFRPAYASVAYGVGLLLATILIWRSRRPSDAQKA